MTLKTKNRLLILGFGLVVLLAYQFAIKNTIDARKELNTLETGMHGFDNIPEQLAVLRAKNNYLDSILEVNKIKTTALENNLLQKLNLYADSTQLKIVSFNKPHLTQQDESQINTYDFTIEGSYNALIGLIYQLEKKVLFGEVIHLQFSKKKNYRSNKYYLQTRVLLKTIN